MWSPLGDHKLPTRLQHKFIVENVCESWLVSGSHSVLVISKITFMGLALTRIAIGDDFIQSNHVGRRMQYGMKLEDLAAFYAKRHSNVPPSNLCFVCDRFCFTPHDLVLGIAVPRKPLSGASANKCKALG